MNIRVSRTVVEVAIGKPGEDRADRPIEAYAECSAFVLLGEAGAGKSTEFRRVAEETKDGHYLTARNFLALAVHPGWRNRTLFIDALDERRAGSQDRRAPLDEIRSKLDQLDRPRFRISCRSVDWLGLNDQSHLSEVSRDGKVTILYLNPLADRDVMEILQRANLIPAPKEFVQTAKEYGLGTLLTNPLTLHLLAKSVAEQDWPRTRTEVFLRASKLLVSEQNEEHQLSARIPFSAEQKLDIAGRLFAVKILTGKDGYSISANHGGSCITISDAQTNDPDLADTVLHSGVFKQGAAGQYVAFHEAIAEFLAGRFLASEVGNGLPVGRVHSLMAGYDGVTLPHFRAVAAWIATHSPVCRRELVSADPIGAMLDGDVATFPIDDKIHVLESINTKSKDNPWFIYNLQSDDSRLGSLASADLAEYYTQNLGSPLRTDSHQVHVSFLLDVLKHGTPVSETSETVLRLAGDNTWRHEVRIKALEVLIRLPSSEVRREEILLNLWCHVDSGEIADGNDEMRGLLLQDLYPQAIGPSQILDHLRQPKEPRFFGSYRAFWDESIAKQSSALHLAVLMDRIADRFAEMSQVLWGHMIGANPFPAFIPSIATRAILESNGDVVPQRLFRWLRIFTNPELRVSQDDQDKVRAWIASHKDVRRQVFECCVDHCLAQANFKHCLSWMEYYLGLDTASDYAQMCKATAKRVENPEASRVLEDRAINPSQATPLQIAQRVIDVPSASAGERSEILDHRERTSVDPARWKDPSVNTLARNQYEAFKTHQDALRENRSDPATLFRLARIYFGELPESSAGLPDTRLRDSLLDDVELIEAVRIGLRNAAIREDLPGVNEFARLFDMGQIHYLALPVLASLEELGLESPIEFGANHISTRLALMLHFGVQRMNRNPWRKNSTVVDSQRNPAWYERLARNEPTLVAREFVRSVRSCFRSRRSLLGLVGRLSSEPDRSVIAPIVVGQILGMFPVRCGNAELKVLAILLGLARWHCDEREFDAVIKKKLRSRSMAIAQRVYWLTAAFLASPAAYRSTFQDTVGTSQSRIRRMVEFVGYSRHDLLGRLRTTDLAYLIEMAGSSYGPDTYLSESGDSKGAVWTSPAHDPRFMTKLIERLGNRTSRGATEALERTRSDESLKPWRPWLSHAADSQRARRREAEFSYGSADAVCRVLSGREPANSADLAVLTADALTNLAERIGYGNTSDWKQYWTRAGEMSEWQPLNENDCRDALLSDLRSRLSDFGIDCQREPNYLDSKRADVRVACSGFGVPIEIKKSNHHEVWSSIQSQLIPKYTQDPECHGCGIYVVFWFGRDFLQPPPSGRKPSSPEQMREMLIASLEEDERRKIGVVVVDVSRDQAAAD